MDFFCDYLAILKAIHHKPMVLTTHGAYFHTGDWYGLKRLYFNTVTRSSLQAYEQVVSVSAADFRLISRIRPDATVIPNGIYAEQLGAIKRNPDSATIIALGVSDLRKRADLLLRTHFELRRLVPEARLLLIGPVARAPKAPGVQWMGHVDDKGLASVLGRATLICSASDYESFGMGIVEAIAAGVPAALRPGHPLLDEPLFGGTAFEVDFNNPSDAARILADLVRDKERLRRSSELGRHAAEFFDWDRIEAIYRDVYAKAMR